MADSPPPGNPYAAPGARLSDPTIAGATGELIENGRRVEAAHGPHWFGRAWELFKVSPGAFIGSWVILAVISVGASLIPIAGSLIGILVQPILIGGFMTACRAADEREPVRVSSLFSAFSTHPGRLAALGLLQFAAYLLLGLIGGLTAVALLGSDAKQSMLNPGVLLPFLIVVVVAIVVGFLLAMANWFAPALIVLQGIGPLDAVRMSFLACMKNVTAFLLYGLLGIVLAIAATLPVALGWLVLGPVLLCSAYAGYRDLFFQPSTTQPQAGATRIS
jgi:uncharacterized membrane protein